MLSPLGWKLYPTQATMSIPKTVLFSDWIACNFSCLLSLQPVLQKTGRGIFFKAVLWSECLCSSKIRVKMLTSKSNDSRWGHFASWWDYWALLTSDLTEPPLSFPMWGNNERSTTGKRALTQHRGPGLPSSDCGNKFLWFISHPACWFWYNSPNGIEWAVIT